MSDQIIIRGKRSETASGSPGQTTVIIGIGGSGGGHPAARAQAFL